MNNTKSPWRDRRNPKSEAQEAAFHAPLHARGKQTNPDARHGVQPGSGVSFWIDAPREGFTQIARTQTFKPTKGLNDRGILSPE